MEIDEQHIAYPNWNISVRDMFAPSVLILLASNAVVIIWALIERWPLPFVLCVYWAQSVIIGIFWFFTILTYGKIYKCRRSGGLEDYSVLNLAQRAQAAGFFAAHYGAIHFAYIKVLILGFFLTPIAERARDITGGTEYKAPDFPFKPLLIVAGVFFIGRLFAFVGEQKENAQKQANVAKLTYFPYFRIVPMHAAMVLAASLEKGDLAPQSALLFFLLLKTVADVFMHIVQKKGFSDDIADAGIDDLGPRFALTLDGPALVMPDGRSISLADKPKIAQKLRNIAQFPKDIRLQVCQKLLGIQSEPQEVTARPEMKCLCEQEDFIEGESVQKYIDGHLEWLETAEDGLTSRYICPDTKKTWVMVAGVLKAEQPKADEGLCRCQQIDRLDGQEAQRYAKEHLKVTGTDGGWRITYICPYTDKRWLLDYTKMTDTNLSEYARLRAMPPANPESTT